jgi:hypothetical protein
VINPAIDRLVEEGSLRRQDFTDGEVAGYWAKALTSAADARTGGLSPDGAYQFTYTAALQATMALLAAHGLRVKSTSSHYKAFLALQQLDGTLHRHGVRFDSLRSGRHKSVYEPSEDDDIETRLTRAREIIADAFPVIRAVIVESRPGLQDQLHPL